MDWGRLIADAEAFANPHCKQDLEDPLQWEVHVPLVRKYARVLAEEEGADARVVDLAAILHDIGKDRGREGHHERTHELARVFLQGYQIPEGRRDLLLRCILKHRTRFTGDPDPVEAKIIRSADVLAVLFDEPWQTKSRKSLSKDELLSLYDKSLRNIELESARKIAKPRLAHLKSLLPSQ